ncbi:MAG: NAD-dependent deacetylase [Desulfuromonadaceae bacterium]|nr:NAD-dependent deacetylase [Desulfuromonadaceae bacterium]MDD5107437.1 NAD-dependent deacetylase [Desulfuromonadaceae bacterium]
MFKQAASIIREADTFVITAGAGMGVDSGLPDFRGDEGFWNAYPAYSRLGISFVECANPQHFVADPSFGWGFYGHRTNLYRDTIPHDGFHIIRRWIERSSADYFVVTSNVDGQFQKAGYDDDRILEVHGSIHWLQCQKPCSDAIWTNDEVIRIDERTMRAREPLPRCSGCGLVSRPNILMFGDWSWLPDRTHVQESAFERFLSEHAEHSIAVIELGAGCAIPTIRATSERIGWDLEHATVIRINPREPEIKAPHISLSCAALEGLRKIDEMLQESITKPCPVPPLPCQAAPAQ